METRPKPTRRKRTPTPNQTSTLKHGFYARRFRRGEMDDLDLTGPVRLADEIQMMRVVIRRVFDQANDEAADLETWSQALETLGAAASRLATLLRTQNHLDKHDKEVTDALSHALSQVLEGMEA
ncbi:MAG: hypothetical protein M1281_17075 [Chloroflexi bacterium]|nr:hypothetical protein [Chloroflexota bacterium]